ncbi:MAG TPA: hypothetical protein ENN80_09375, partial [Candidatus Hydrogenedentes bacterium]|nr:hypothetical protein [Candidatus Hydrogenedentota bacterium]
MPAMLVGIHQLHYLPWLRYFEKIACSDVFIVLDNIQYNKNGWQNRNKVKTAAGATLLTTPVRFSAGDRLDQVRIDSSKPWARKHWETIRQAYAKAPHFADHAAFIEGVYAQSWVFLNDLNRTMLAYFIEALGIETRVVYASELDVPGVATERLIHLIQAVGGDRYYTGAFATDAYLDVKLLDAAGIEVVVQDWCAPV